MAVAPIAQHYRFGLGATLHGPLEAKAHHVVVGVDDAPNIGGIIENAPYPLPDLILRIENGLPIVLARVLTCTTRTGCTRAAPTA